MTLKISHGAFHDMCSEFHHWRCAIAQAAGYTVEDDWAGGDIILDWDRISDGNIAGLWPSHPQMRSSCCWCTRIWPARLSPQMLSGLRTGLSELLIPSQWRAVTKNFIEACRLAGSRNEPLRFDYDQFATIARLIADFQREKFAAVARPRKTNWTGHRSAIH